MKPDSQEVGDCRPLSNFLRCWAILLEQPPCRYPWTAVHQSVLLWTQNRTLSPGIRRSAAVITFSYKTSANIKLVLTYLLTYSSRESLGKVRGDPLATDQSQPTPHRTPHFTTSQTRTSHFTTAQQDTNMFMFFLYSLTTVRAFSFQSSDIFLSIY